MELVRVIQYLEVALLGGPIEPPRLRRDLERDSDEVRELTLKGVRRPFGWK